MQLQTSSTTETNATETGTLHVNGASLSVIPAPQNTSCAIEEESRVSASEVEAAIQQWHLAQAKRSRRETARQSWAIFRHFLLLSACLSPLLALRLTSNPHLLAGGLVALLGFSIVLCILNARPKVPQSVEAIAEMEDVRAVGPLLEIINAAAYEQQVVICAALSRLLPRLQAEEAGLLPPSQWQALHGCITNRMFERHPEFVIACLEALERVGNEHALSCLTLLVVQDAPTQAMQAVRERAKQCLRAITARLNFGTTQDIPAWIARLPRAGDYSHETARFLSDSAWDEYLIATFALTRLLPLLTPADAELLDKEAHSRLGASTAAPRYALTHGYTRFDSGGFVVSRLGPDYDLARLTAFEQIGTGSDIPYINYAVTSAEHLPVMRARAKTVLAILEARREKERAGETLLRGSSAPPTPSRNLLRPAQASSAPTAPDELLRPAAVQE